MSAEAWEGEVVLWPRLSSGVLSGSTACACKHGALRVPAGARSEGNVPFHVAMPVVADPVVSHPHPLLPFLPNGRTCLP